MDNGALEIIEKTPPAELPVTLEEAKDWLRVETGDDDALIGALISSATDDAEKITRRSLVTRSLTARFRDFPFDRDVLRLPYPSVSDVTAIQYIDTNGDPQSFDVAKVEILSKMYGWVRPNLGESWPADADPGTVALTYDSGYGAAADVPDEIKTAIKLIVGQLYEIRTDQVVGVQFSAPQVKASERILQGYRVRFFG